MTIIGIGTDLVSVARFTRLLERGGRRFLDRWFLPDEVAYCLARSEPARHAAVRFAAKEATLKSMGLVGTGRPPWRDIEVSRDLGGSPGVRLHGGLGESAVSLGARFYVSVAHDLHYATATVVAVSGHVTCRPDAG